MSYINFRRIAAKGIKAVLDELNANYERLTNEGSRIIESIMPALEESGITTLRTIARGWKLGVANVDDVFNNLGQFTQDLIEREVISPNVVDQINDYSTSRDALYDKLMPELKQEITWFAKENPDRLVHTYAEWMGSLPQGIDTADAIRDHFLTSLEADPMGFINWLTTFFNPGTEEYAKSTQSNIVSWDSIHRRLADVDATNLQAFTSALADIQAGKYDHVLKTEDNKIGLNLTNRHHSEYRHWDKAGIPKAEVDKMYDIIQGRIKMLKTSSINFTKQAEPGFHLRQELRQNPKERAPKRDMEGLSNAQWSAYQQDKNKLQKYQEGIDEESLKSHLDKAHQRPGIKSPEESEALLKQFTPKPPAPKPVGPSHAAKPKSKYYITSNEPKKSYVNFKLVVGETDDAYSVEDPDGKLNQPGKYSADYKGDPTEESYENLKDRKKKGSYVNVLLLTAKKKKENPFSKDKKKDDKDDKKDDKKKGKGKFPFWLKFKGKDKKKDKE